MRHEQDFTAWFADLKTAMAKELETAFERVPFVGVLHGHVNDDWKCGRDPADVARMIVAGTHRSDPGRVCARIKAFNDRAYTGHLMP